MTTPEYITIILQKHFKIVGKHWEKQSDGTPSIKFFFQNKFKVNMS